MNKEDVYLTEDGLNELKAELDDLVNKKRPDVLEALRRAREAGDLSENSLYDQSRSQQSFIEGRIEELEEVIERAKIITKAATDQVSLGSKVLLVIEGDDEELTIVGEPEADPTQDKISHKSPLGLALMGKKVGDAVEVDAPAGKITYTIKSIA